jgi:hypothetical protein
MQEKDKHKTYSKEELLKLMKEGKDAPADMDDFDREAMEGLKLVKNEEVLHKLNDEVDTIVEEEKRKKKAVYYFSAAASLLLLIGLVFLFKNSFTNKDEKPLALAEKPKEESVSLSSNTTPQTETQPLREDKELEKDERKKDEITTLNKEGKKIDALQDAEPAMDTRAAKNDKTGKDQYHEAPDANTKVVKDAESNLSDETKPLSKRDVVTTTGTSANQGPPNKQEEQTIAANETVTNSNAAANGGAGYGDEKAKAKKSRAKESQQPSQALGGVSQADNSSAPVNAPIEQKVVAEESKKTAGLYASDKNTTANNYKAPSFINGDSAFAGYAKQNLKISSPDKSGLITVSFTVTKNGVAQNIEVTKPIPNCATCSDDIINLIKSVKKWQPAIMNGKAIDATKKISVQYN